MKRVYVCPLTTPSRARSRCTMELPCLATSFTSPLDTVDFELTKKAAANLIFSKDIRRKKFGGVV